MAAGCLFHRTLVRSQSRPESRAETGPNQETALCREQLVVLAVDRYMRDQSTSLCFPQSVLQASDLYDVTLSDGDCMLRVSLDSSLNHLVQKYTLRRGVIIKSATFRRCLALQLPRDPDQARLSDSFNLESLEVCGLRLDLDPAPCSWFGSSPGSGPGPFQLLPLRAKREVFLSPWNNVDPHGERWRQEEEEEGVQEQLKASVSVFGLQQTFQASGCGGTIQKLLIVRVEQKSSLMFYGRTESNNTCPYKAVLKVCDESGSVTVVLWNTVCLDWYCRLFSGDIISLRRFRVKPLFLSEKPDAIEISVNSRNPATLIRKLPESRVSPRSLPPMPQFSFCTSAELRLRPHGEECDVIGLLVFSGRCERLRSKDSKGAELYLEFRWLRLEDHGSKQPITVKLFATSQPEVHRHLLPMSVVVCTRLRLVRTRDQAQFYLTNTSSTQVYCTGLGLHSRMAYRKLDSVKLFLKWLRAQDEDQMLRHALIGGHFVFPPPPVTVETFMRSREVAPVLLQGAELQRELDRLCYRERRSFCFQATVSTVTHCRRGQEEQHLSCSLHHLSSPVHLSAGPSPFPTGPSPVTTGPSVHSLRSPSSPCSSVVSQLRPHPLEHTHSRTVKRKLFPPQSPDKRPSFSSLRPDPGSDSVMLFEASLEFLQDSNSEEGSTSCDITLAPPPTAPAAISVETLPLRFDPAHKEEQAIAMTLGANLADSSDRFQFAFEDFYSLRLQVLSGLSLDALFLPHSPLTHAPVTPHANSWAAILSHGTFSPHAPPPSPADLIATATQQLSRRRLMCVLDACRLDGTSLELVLVQAFVLC